MIAITSVYWLLFPVALILECLWWGVPRQIEIEPMGGMGPDLLFLCYNTGSALCLISRWTCRSEPSPWVSVWPELVRPCCWLAACQGAGGMCWGTCPVSCPRTASLGPALWESLGSCSSLTSLFTSRKEHFCTVKKALVTCEGCCIFSVVLQSQYLQVGFLNLELCGVHRCCKLYKVTWKES